MNRVTFGCMSQSRSMLTMVPRPVMVPTRLSSRGGLWQKFKDNKKRMAQFGGLFLVVKACHFPPIMYVCSFSPYLFGYETPTEWIQSMQWLKKYIDVDHHLHVDENAKPPLPIRLIEWLGAAITGQADYEISPYFHSPAFFIDFAATFFIYEFVISPVKWPYYFWATAQVHRSPIFAVGLIAFWGTACALVHHINKE